ncbi:serine protease [Mesorhizobium sp. M0244]|uniref:serine protease n=1 Tax=Mesorhizobium sp. M0244 TaxID=2956926 RepID=UPI0033352285
MPRATQDLSISPEARRQVYAARRYVQRDVQEELDLRIPFDVYFQDPAITASDQKFDFADGFLVPWEPGLGDGPTSARFVVVDYDGGTESFAAPAKWDPRRNVFLDQNGDEVDRNKLNTPQFHQVNVWATLQNGLDYFENGFGLGRPIRWGFEGNRLIVVPHAGYGENAYYDRESKSLQFYYFDRPAGRVFTCLSADIINHEFGHAVLDGLRPYYNESVLPETAGFHEFMGDMAAILIAFRNNAFRAQLVAKTEGDLDSESALSSIADEFGRQVKDRPYLRSALNKQRFADVKDSQSQHFMSEVLTGAIFDILRRLSRYYIDVEKLSVAKAFWYTVRRMQNVAVQPLDLLPPVDVTFKDYAIAVLRAEEIANPSDPDGQRAMMLDAFIQRGLIDESEREELGRAKVTFRRLPVDIFHDVETIANSRAYAYRFLDDNRKSLLIPYTADIVLPEVTTAQKFTIDGRRQPKQVLVQYVWREDVELNGAEFGAYEGQTTSLLCGGTIALDENGNVLHWARKPGTGPQLGTGRDADDELEEGRERRAACLSALARRIAAGRINNPIGGEAGLLEKSIAPLGSRVVDGTVRFHLAPHIGLHDDRDDEMGDVQWQISS